MIWLIGRAVGAYGSLGVKNLFVISGFVICRGFIKERERFGRNSLPAFYARRALRILPPLVLFIAAIATLATLGFVEGRSIEVYKALGFVCNPPDWQCGGYLGGHFWSLSTEEQFYLIFPALLVGLPLQWRANALGLLAVAVPMAAMALYWLKLTDIAGVVFGFICISLGVACASLEKPIAGAVANVPGWLFAVALFYVCSIEACIAFSYLSFFVMEKPLLEFGRALSTRMLAR